VHNARTAGKIELVGQLIDAGLRRLEITSFVSSTAAPQLSDADWLTRHAVKTWPKTQATALVLTHFLDEYVARWHQAGVVAGLALEKLGTNNCLCKAIDRRKRSTTGAPTRKASGSFPRLLAVGLQGVLPALDAQR